MSGIGLDAQFGMVAESVYGTYVAPTRFLEMQSETLAPVFEELKSHGLGAGHMQRMTHVARNIIGGGGNTVFHVFDKGFGLLLEHCLGTIASAQQGGTAEYRHRATPDLTNRMEGLSATVQIGKPSVDGTVNPFSFVGGKVTGFELAANLGEAVMITPSWDFQDVVVDEALAAASYASGRTPFFYSDSSVLTIDSVDVFARSVKIAVENALDVDRRHVVGRLKREPKGSELFVVTGELDLEFESIDHYNDIVTAEVLDFDWTITGDTIPTTANPFKIVVDIPYIWFPGQAPAVSGRGIVRRTMQFEALWDGSTAPITIDYHTNDTAP